MLFEFASGLTNLIHIISKDDVVRIAHRDKCTVALSASSYKLFFVFEYRLQHVHRDTLHNVIKDMQIEYLDARQRKQTNLSLLVTIPLHNRVGLLIEILSNTPRRIAAHHCL